MQIKFCTQQVNMSSQEMMELSRTVKRCREEAENVRRQLQQLSGMGECRSAIFKMEESMALLTARMAGLSSSLREISELYSSAERRNLSVLESCPRPIRGTEEAPGHGTEDKTRYHL